MADATGAPGGDAAPSDGGAGGSSGVPAIEVDYQPPAPMGLRTATVDQLKMLRDGKRDAVAEIGWAMLALVIGAAPSALPAIHRAYFTTGGAALSGGDLVQVIMVMVGAALGLGCVGIVLTRGRRAEDIFDQIVNPGSKTKP